MILPAAIRATMARSGELRLEAEYLAWVDLEARLRGANHLAYPPVVAAGTAEGGQPSCLPTCGSSRYS